MTLHLADLSNPLRPTPIAAKWAKLLLEEFFAQGDKETSLHLPISPLCDRQRTELANSQLGFLQHVVMPFLTTFTLVLPELNASVMPVARKNLTYWEYQKTPMLTRRTQSQYIPPRNNEQNTAATTAAPAEETEQDMDKDFSLKNNRDTSMPPRLQPHQPEQQTFRQSTKSRSTSKNKKLPSWLRSEDEPAGGAEREREE
eukprot:c16695_g1_i3.p1 GENE.c16695_g1_i3~~c16695_g1_i3.p1  ORF type:complete len:200 (+),score=39.78 c16695_g1_i3:71-670(+)